jgi:hypothetical protein
VNAVIYEIGVDMHVVGIRVTEAERASLAAYVESLK